MLTTILEDVDEAPVVETTAAQSETIELPQDEPTSGDNAANQSGEQTIEPAAEETGPAVEEKTFTLNLAASDVDKEMAKRKARAERFQTGGQADADAESTETATADTDALKNLERAKRFGTGQTAIGKLDEALSTERERGSRGKKRGVGAVDENAVLDDPGLKKSFSKKPHFAQRRRGGPGKPTAVAKPSAAAFSSDKDRQAAETRKKRFGA